MTKALDAAGFEKLIAKSDKPLLVDFWAEWCGPCKMLAPILDQIEGEHGDDVSVVKINIEESPDIGSKYGVRSIPTMALFKGGKQVATKIGLHQKEKIIDWIKDNT